MKKIILFSLIFVLSFFVIKNQSLASENQFPGMVKIHTYALDEFYRLSYKGSGSGAIIDARGIIITNHHVISVNDKMPEHAYIICLEKNQNEKPECLYTANLIAYDESLDVALLEINNIKDYSFDSSYPYFEYYKNDTTDNGQSIRVLGYPAIGGANLSVTQGTISGKEAKYNRNWLKTDAVVSYGSSGGIAIDDSGKIVGLTSMAYSDTIASLGYIINIDSLVSFIDNNINSSASSSILTSRMEEIVKLEFDSLSTNQIYDTSHFFQFNKPSDWSLDIDTEGSASVFHPEDDDAGSFSIEYDIFPIEISGASYINYFKLELGILGLLMNIVRSEDVNIGGISGQKFRMSFMGESMDLISLHHKNYNFIISYDYGENDKDKEKIDNILDSLSFNLSNISTISQREFLHNDPFISLFSDDYWGILSYNSDDYLVSMLSTVDPNIIVKIGLKEIDNNLSDYSASEYLNHLKELKQKESLAAHIFGVELTLKEENDNYYLSPQISDAIILKYEYKNPSSNLSYYSKEYYKKIADNKYLKITLLINPTDDYQASILRAEQALQNLNLGLSEVIIQEEKSIEKVIETKTEIKDQAMHSNLKGKIILQVESNGEAYYIHPERMEIFFLGRPEDAFKVMREQGIGISNDNLNKIPVADTLALKREFDSLDSDGDGYSDYTEMISGYNPYGPEKLNHDLNFSQRNAGKIFLQVENNGEAWYVNPEDNKRYFLGRPNDAFEIMRTLGLGISNDNFDKLQK